MGFSWEPVHHNAFCKLTFPEFARGFILKTDASEVGLGAILAQSHEDVMVRSIAYARITPQEHDIPICRIQAADITKLYLKHHA